MLLAISAFQYIIRGPEGGKLIKTKKKLSNSLVNHKGTLSFCSAFWWSSLLISPVGLCRTRVALWNNLGTDGRKKKYIVAKNRDYISS